MRQKIVQNSKYSGDKIKQRIPATSTNPMKTFNSGDLGLTPVFTDYTKVITTTNKKARTLIIKYRTYITLEAEIGSIFKIIFV